MESLGEVYSVGSFAQIVEMRDLGAVIELILSARRRIRILEPIDESADGPSFSRLNGRRVGQQQRKNFVDAAAQRKMKEEGNSASENSESPTEAGKTPKIIYAKTENLAADPFEKTVEVKVKFLFAYFLSSTGNQS